MPRVGFEPTIQMFVRSKTFRALGRRGRCNRSYGILISSTEMSDGSNRLHMSGFKMFLCVCVCVCVEFLHKFRATGTEQILSNTGTYDV
jgi:hypothetical protein